MDMPCRSCGILYESDRVIGEFTGHIKIHCSKQIPPKDCPILAYGVSYEEQGKCLCEYYSHKGFDW